MNSLQGQFLVASPKLGDSNFYRTVVLMIHHDEEGAMGLVLTRPTDTPVSELWEHLQEEPLDGPSAGPLGDASWGAPSLGPVFLGGPVPGPLIAVHDLLDCSESEILRGLYVATQRATLQRLLQSTARVRLFSGYSGWGAGQLESELRAGGWLMCDATADRVLGDVETLWNDVVREIGQSILGPHVDRRHLPDDPSLN